MFLIDDILIISGYALLGGIIGGITGGTAGALIGIVIDVLLDASSIKKEVNARYPEALKILIQQKKRNSIKVGIFNEYDDEIETGVEISSTRGISKELYVGQEIYL